MIKANTRMDVLKKTQHLFTQGDQKPFHPRNQNTVSDHLSVPIEPSEHTRTGLHLRLGQGPLWVEIV